MASDASQQDTTRRPKGAESYRAKKSPYHAPAALRRKAILVLGRDNGREHDNLFTDDGDWRTLSDKLLHFLLRCKFELAFSLANHLQFTLGQEAARRAVPNGATIPLAELAELSEQQLIKIAAAYATSFHKSRPFLDIWLRIKDRDFQDHLLDVRHHITIALAEEHARRVADMPAMQEHERRRKLYQNTPTDLPGDDIGEQIKHLSPHDWHEVSHNWNWGFGMKPIQWLIEQPTLNRTSAGQFFIYFSMCDVIADSYKTPLKPHQEESIAFLGRIAELLHSGFYAMPGFKAHDPKEMDLIRAQHAQWGDPRWTLPPDLFTDEGKLPHDPKYCAHDGHVQYTWKYWEAHIEPPQEP